MERETAISLLRGLTLVIEAIAEECFGDARTLLESLVSQLQDEPGIEPSEKEALLGQLKDASDNLYRIGGHPRGAAVILARVSRELWGDVLR